MDAARALRQGAVLLYPAEGVWGLGCDPDDEAAVRRLLALKQREPEKGLILVADTLERLAPLLRLDALDPGRRDAVLASWPGPHTWLVPCVDSVPAWIRGRFDTLAVRVVEHPPMRALCRAFAAPLVSTSANRAGQPAARRFEEIDPGLLAEVDGVVAGETADRGVPSSIRDARSGELLRG